MKQSIEGGKALTLTVTWYDSVPEPPRNQVYEGEVIGWRETQVIVRVKGYAVLRFWKGSGLEVGNPSYKRRGFRVELSELASNSPTGPPSGVSVELDA